MKKESVLANFTQTRTKLVNLLNQIPVKGIDSTSVEGIWTVKDILGHITAWEIPMVEPLQELASGGNFSPTVITDGEKYNLDNAKKRETMSLEEILAEMEAVRTTIMETAARLPEEAWDFIYPAPWGGEDSLVRLFEGLTWHENEHTHAIQMWLEGNR